VFDFLNQYTYAIQANYPIKGFWANIGTKQCPICGERINLISKKCRFCNEWLNVFVEETQKDLNHDNQ
jgi:hypothetical protein